MLLNQPRILQHAPMAAVPNRVSDFKPVEAVVNLIEQGDTRHL